MQKTILITGATDGIGLETAKALAAKGHNVVLHGRNPQKTADAAAQLASLEGDGSVTSHVADLSRMADVVALATQVADTYTGDSGAKLDVLINNAGVYGAGAGGATTGDGFDVRFAVNTIAPYLLTRHLLPTLGTTGRVVNVASAAQSSFAPAALLKPANQSDGAAYAQSKLALIMWSRALAASNTDGPAVIPVNPGSMLGSKMVKDAFGVAGGDIAIGADILTRAALDDEFKIASGQYFDNDLGRFSDPHSDALDLERCAEVVRVLETVRTTHSAS